MAQEVIGRVTATKDKGNTNREFHFWVEPETEINPLDLIVVKDTINTGEEQSISREVYAQILDITSYTDAESFLEVFASTDFGNVNLESDVDRIAFNVAKAQVLDTSGNIRMPVQFNSSVYLADEEVIMRLLKVEELAEGYKLPIGYIEQSDGVKVPVRTNVNWLTGPDGAHLNVSGKTRLASKTSYVLCLISSILQTQNDTAVIIFNVKGSDLLQVHQPNKYLAAEGSSDELDDEAAQELTEIKDGWKSMGLQAEPFDEDNVFYFLPSHRNNPDRISSDLNNLPTNSDAITSLPNNYSVYRYTLDDVRGRFRLLLSSQNPNDVQQQFIDALDNINQSAAFTSNTFQALSQTLGNIVQAKNDYLNSYYTTVGVVRRQIDTVTRNRTTGVFDYERPTLGGGRVQLPSNFISCSLQAGQTLVVDIAPINEPEQQWVFGDVLNTVERLMMGDIERDDKPRKVVIFVDELNKYAPSGTSSPLTTDLLDITGRGGALGVILFGAEQFASRIHPQVFGSCANKAFGLTDATEATTEPYRSFPTEIRQGLSELERGELLIQCDYFGMPLRIKFPRPACRKQEDVD